ncbi:MAG: redoxin domain-containing protein, partial [Flavobacteriaceae bacterium]|nr:redoxin domain-containing protein [Flavobacteriaceae bacterium]
MTIVRILFLSFLGSAVLTGCKNKPSSTVSTKEKPQFTVYNFEELEPLLNRDDNAIHIVNFWATWCKPCIEELPVFQEIHETDKNIEVLLVSLDFPDKVDEQLKPFIRK